ncbi:MAG: hypothetical protein AUJ85_08050 [Elusimicrobia bacterium CG1_02_37_114]|nr:MAG: hypothetical protein AUJ85_08050 [Elusimicrobia bacterium CG1_02_37_114]PIV52846.1 MAG: two-component system response regulator [Elusimicrobia bacterium CG02_land_8_20_14_3_00_37_13]PIZ13452.1 MAG: two-component system response regulator [Elusimicrobia bacterium CG_4_10_14_0_8_um_filter_37_32]
MKKVLIADDDRHLVKLITSLLKDAGYVTKQAYEGATTLKLIREFKPDVVILDIMMPIIDGYHICKILAEEIEYSPAPKIIVLTVRKEEWDRRISEIAGADAFMAKPFNNEELLRKVKELSEKQEQEQEHQG